jgi:hypothetical protein
MPESIPVEAFLEDYPPSHRAIANRLRAIVRRAAPDAIERVRLGWRLIGYDVPIGRRTVYFAWVFPEVEHVHLGFTNGVLIDDRAGALIGTGITKRARWLTYGPGDPIDEAVAIELVRAAEGVARIPRSALE